MSRREKRLRLTHRPVVGDSMHAEGELLARVLQQLTPLRESLGNHLALLDPLGLIVALPSQPENRKGGAGTWRSSCFLSNRPTGLGFSASRPAVVRTLTA